jgi:hypothetical protein
MDNDKLTAKVVDWDKTERDSLGRMQNDPVVANEFPKIIENIEELPECFDIFFCRPHVVIIQDQDDLYRFAYYINVNGEKLSFLQLMPYSDVKAYIKDVKAKELVGVEEGIAHFNRLHDEQFPDPILRPSHYTHGGIETIDIQKAKSTPEQFQGHLYNQVIKYVLRWGKKEPGINDLLKAQYYLNKLIYELREKDGIKLTNNTPKIDELIKEIDELKEERCRLLKELKLSQYRINLLCDPASKFPQQEPALRRQ